MGTVRVTQRKGKEMPKQKNKMICPRCGAEMNHHADKLVYPVTAEDARDGDATLGGIIEETHGCPGCGGVESRRAV
jgi:ribosomal protein S27AE